MEWTYAAIKTSKSKIFGRFSNQITSQVDCYLFQILFAKIRPFLLLKVLEKYLLLSKHMITFGLWEKKPSQSHLHIFPIIANSIQRFKTASNTQIIEIQTLLIAFTWNLWEIHHHHQTKFSIVVGSSLVLKAGFKIESVCYVNCK